MLPKALDGKPYWKRDSTKAEKYFLQQKKWKKDYVEQDDLPTWASMEIQSKKKKKN